MSSNWGHRMKLRVEKGTGPQDPIRSLAQPGACQLTWRKRGWCTSNLLWPALLPPASLSSSEKSFPRKLASPYLTNQRRNAFKCNECRNSFANDAFQCRRRAQFGILHSYLWVAANLALPCIHFTFHPSAWECRGNWKLCAPVLLCFATLGSALLLRTVKYRTELCSAHHSIAKAKAIEWWVPCHCYIFLHSVEEGTLGWSTVHNCTLQCTAFQNWSEELQAECRTPGITAVYTQSWLSGRLCIVQILPLGPWPNPLDLHTHTYVFIARIWRFFFFLTQNIAKCTMRTKGHNSSHETM